jgi:hypothetical protein
MLLSNRYSIGTVKPINPEEGEEFQDGISNKLYVFTNGTWVELKPAPFWNRPDRRKSSIKNILNSENL